MAVRDFFDRVGMAGVAMAGFLGGIAVHSLKPFARSGDWWPIGFAGGALVLASLAPTAGRRRAAWLLAAAALGFWRFDATVPRTADLFWLGHQASFVGEVAAASGEGAKATYIIKLEEAGGAAVTSPGNGVALKSGSQGLGIGEKISFGCTAKASANLERRRMLARKGVWSECATVSDLRVTSAPSPYDPLVWLARWRAFLTRRIQGVLPPDEAALMAGILYGEQNFSAEMHEDFKRAGLMHLVAVSGSNVTILVAICLSVALGLGLDRRRAFWAVSLALLAFVGFVGFSASVLRAAWMGWLVILARHVGRLPQTWRLLLVAAACLNAANPWQLAFDPGFALSFLATWGLLAWAPLFLRRLARVPQTLGLRETVATTLAATLMTAPYLAWAFGRLSLAGLFTNALALPLVPWAMAWGALAAAWGDWPGWRGLSLPAYGLANAIIRLGRASRLAPWLDLRVPNMEWAMLAAGYVWMSLWWRSMAKDAPVQSRGVDMAVNYPGMSADADIPPEAPPRADRMLPRGAGDVRRPRQTISFTPGRGRP